MSYMTKRSGKSPLTAALLTFLLSTTALVPSAMAADPAPADESAKASDDAEVVDEGVVLPQIIVTADRPSSFGADYVQAGTFRNARVIDTPLTVSVIPQALMESQQATSLLDALRNSAGVTSAQINSAIYNNMAIRGLVVENRGNYRMNGVLPIINLIDMPVENKDRVEVLKGASALYYGFTTPSGIINLTTKRPTKNPITNVTLLGNSNGAYGQSVDWSRSWGNYGLRINENISKVDIGVDRTDGHKHFISAAFDWKPNDKFFVTVDGEYIYKKITEPTGYSVRSTATALPQLLDSSHNVGGKWMYAVGEEANVLLHTQYNLTSAWSVSFDTGLSVLERDRRYSAFYWEGNSATQQATGNGRVYYERTPGNYYQNITYRGELAGVVETGPFEHEVVFGYSQNDRVSRVPTTASSFYNTNLYNPIDPPEVALTSSTVPNPSKIVDKGYYVFDSIKYDEWATLMLGIRHTDYSDVSKTSAYEKSANSPSVGLVLKPFDWASVYATYIEGLESGGVAPAAATNAGETLPAGVTKQKEFGVKVSPIKDLLLTAAYFSIERPNSFLDSTSNTYVNSGLQKYKGWELSATGEITKDLSIYTSALFLDAKALSGKSGATDLAGKRVENSAKFTGSVYLEYRLPMVEGLAISGGAFHVGSRAINATNTFFVDGYTTYSAGIRYTTPIYSKPVTFRLNAENLTDEKYWESTGSSLLGQGLPMYAKFSVTTEF